MGSVAAAPVIAIPPTSALELGVSHADVEVKLGHTDGGALWVSTYGHPFDEAARARVLAAYRNNPAWRLKLLVTDST